MNLWCFPGPLRSLAVFISTGFLYDVLLLPYSVQPHMTQSCQETPGCNVNVRFVRLEIGLYNFSYYVDIRL